MISTIIFDLDGLLADTEILHQKSYQHALGRFGINVSESEYAEHWIRSGKGIEDYVREKKLSADIAAVRKKKAQSYEQLVTSSVVPMPGALQLLENLRGHKTLALASSSYRASVNCVIGTLKITDCFSLIAANEDAPRLKPFPDLFLYAARKLNVQPEHCLVIEDAEKGVLAARAAGMPCIAVPNKYTATNDFSQATMLVSSLEDISLEMLETKF